MKLVSASMWAICCVWMCVSGWYVCMYHCVYVCVCVLSMPPSVCWHVIPFFEVTLIEVICDLLDQPPLHSSPPHLLPPSPSRPPLPFLE